MNDPAGDGVRPSERPAGRLFAATAASNEDQFDPTDWALFLGISVIWGASFLLIAYALEGLTPAMVTLLRVGLGAVALAGVRALGDAGPPIAREDRGRIVLLAIIWVAVPFSLFPIAQQWINSAVTGLLNGATPVLVAVISAALVHVLPGRIQRLGLLVGFAGIVLISLGSAGDGASELRGVILVIVATTCYGFALNMAPPIQAKYGAVVTMSSVLAVATVFVAPLALVNLGENEWQAGAVAAAVVLGVIGTGFAYWIMATLVGTIGAMRASFITYLIPVVSLVLGVWLRNDTVSLLALIGAPLTIIGALLASRRIGA